MAGMARESQARIKLYEIAEQQAGYFTASQALEAGYSYPSQAYQRKADNWLRDGWGIYRLTNFPHTPNEKLVRLMLWSRDRAGRVQAAVSHETALSVYELSDVMPAETHISVPKGFRKRSPQGVLLHRAHLSGDEVQDRNGFRITTPKRTLLDVASSALSPEHLEDATSEALEKGLIRRRALEEA